MKNFFSILLLGILIVCQTSVAQRHRNPDRDRRMPERVEKFQTMRLIEILKLSDEDAARFTAKKRAHDENLGGLMKTRNQAVDDLEDMKEENAQVEGKVEDLNKQIDQVLDSDQKIFAERRRYQDDVRKLLSPGQFAKFIVFERNFGQRVRDAVGKMYDRQRARGRE